MSETKGDIKELTNKVNSIEESEFQAKQPKDWKIGRSDKKAQK